MRLLLVVLTAFFVQSCYTVLYTVDEYQVSNDVTPQAPSPEPVIIVEPPHRPYVPPPATVIYVPVSAPVVQQPTAEPARLRDGASARVPAAVAPSNPEPARLRTPSTGSSSPSRSGSVTDTQHNQPSDQNAVRERTPAQQPQTQTARPRTR